MDIQLFVFGDADGTIGDDSRQGGGESTDRPSSSSSQGRQGGGGRVEQFLRALQPLLPRTCGVDCAVIRSEPNGGQLELRILELNARTNMGHFAFAAKKLLPWARSFNVVRVSELPALISAGAVPLTDPASASMWCAIVQRGQGR